MAGIKYLYGLSKLTAADEFLWQGGSGSLFANGACTLKVRPQDVAAAENTEITVGNDGGLINFQLGKDFVISLSADGWISAFGDGAGLR